MEKPSAAKPAQHIWTPEQLRAFFGEVRTDRLYAMWLLFATTGMRRGEGGGLAWDDVDLLAARVRVTWTLGVVQSKATWKPRPKSTAGEGCWHWTR